MLKQRYEERRPNDQTVKLMGSPVCVARERAVQMYRGSYVGIFQSRD
jgi:hypothetical protein